MASPILTDEDIAQLDSQNVSKKKILTDADIATLDNPNRGKRSLVGNIFERPAAAIRSAVMGKGYVQGANYPEEVPTFQNAALDKYYGMVGKQTKDMTPTQAAIHTGIMSIPGLAVSAGGMVADMATNPADILTTMAGGKAIKALGGTKAGQTVGRFMTKERITPIEAAKNAGQNLFRGGLPKEEVMRISNEYGNSNATLVDKIKGLLDRKLSGADNLFEKTITSAPENISIKTDQFANALKKSISDLESGVGKSNPVVMRLQAMLDDITGEKQVSKVVDVFGKPISKKPAGYIPMDKQTFVGTRRNIGDMLTGNGEVDRYIMQVKDALDNSAIKSGITDLNKAKQAYKTARDMESRFLNRNTGDLKVANEQALSRVGTEKTLSKQQLDHIKELEQYIGHPITRDATNINKINRALEKIKNIKKYGKAIGGTIAAGEIGRKVVTGNF